MYELGSNMDRMEFRGGGAAGACDTGADGVGAGEGGA